MKNTIIVALLSVIMFVNTAEANFRYWHNNMIANEDMVDQLFRELKTMGVFDPETGRIKKGLELTLYEHGITPRSIVEDEFGLRPSLMDVIDSKDTDAYLVLLPWEFETIDEDFDHEAAWKAYEIGGWYGTERDMLFKFDRKFPELKNLDHESKIKKTKELGWFVGPLPNTSYTIEPRYIYKSGLVASIKRWIMSNQTTVLVIGCSIMALFSVCGVIFSAKKKHT